ncbi:ABC transporter G family member 23-like [Oppia nitens]|uniref:ABC transporter G family member 23-like n=1 Tax=Oppia nitens TaxID=1686743 RepID=UPI0023DA225A|nr:ABC transporter G family member 23-like [Oppia nitens]
MSSQINSLEIRDVYFDYKNSVSVLNGIDVTVPKGGIYGLLGSSGCGKTTLLKCSLGRLKPKSGSISLFGHKPGSPESRVPGPGAGYMPQELALYDEFSIDETLVYFGRLFGIDGQVVQSRIEFLMDLLQLPVSRRLVRQLSGGQKRRVSIATALLHNPPFLILDEPTVGLDLILRESIWKHLYFLASNGLTIIVTTHYIEEARGALRVGFMRSGRLLAEGSPDELLLRHGFPTLEAFPMIS